MHRAQVHPWLNLEAYFGPEGLALLPQLIHIETAFASPDTVTTPRHATQPKDEKVTRILRELAPCEFLLPFQAAAG